jgi:hypothetical protein
VTTGDLARLRWPGHFAAWALSSGTFPQALAAIAVAMGFSTLAAYRLATTVNVADLVFGASRSQAIDALIESIGVERTAVLVYMLQRSFDALVVASALTPIFFWLLGSSAMHAAARLRGVRGRPYLPMIILFAFAELTYQLPSSVAGMVLSPIGPAVGAQLASAINLAMLVWFAFVVHRGIELHYRVSGDRALAIFLIGGFVFYLLPLLLIAVTLVSILVAAALLQYF